MLFNSLAFGYFFVATTLLYFVLPHRGRVYLLLVASCYFYAVFVPEFLLILFSLILIDFSAGLYLDVPSRRRRKAVLWASLLSNLSLLFVFKYFNFFAASFLRVARLAGVTLDPILLDVILPIGLSFHTFQSMAYVIEVYRGKARAERNLATYALYVLFYPQLVAGPIERPLNLLPQLNVYQPFDSVRVVEGLRRMLWGFFKKIVIADRAAFFVDRVFDNPLEAHGLGVLLAAYLFAIQIYCDFSGYSDIAVGAARVLGFRFTVNFRQPYFSTSIREFWHRWHISLSTWFRDYVFIPLGGSRFGTWKTYRNLMIVFVVSGLWHGANFTFIVWGAWHGLLLVGQDFLPSRLRLPKIVGALVTFHLVCFGWIFFRANSVGTAVRLIRNLFDFSASNVPTVYTAQEIVVLGLAIGLLGAGDWLDRKVPIELFAPKKPVYVRWATYMALVIGILALGVFNRTQFIYFQF